MEPTKALIDDIFRAKVLRARSIDPGKKFLMGPELFDAACEISRAGIRHMHPEADEKQVEELLRKRFEIRRKLEEMK